MVAGVCAGVAGYLDVDVALVRVAAVALALAGIGLPAYLAAWILVPDEDSDESIAQRLLCDVRGECLAPHRSPSGAQPSGRDVRAG